MANSFGQMFVGLVFLQSVIVTFFTGPTVATLSGLVTAISQAGQTRAAGISGIGSFVGFYVMVILAVVVMSLAYNTGGGSGGSSSFDMANTFMTTAKAGIPTATVGVIAGYIGGSFEGISLSVSEQPTPGRGVSDD